MGFWGLKSTKIQKYREEKQKGKNNEKKGNYDNRG